MSGNQYSLRTPPVVFSSSSGLLTDETGTGDAGGGTGGIGILGILSKSLMWLLGSPSFTRFTLHLCMVSTVDVKGGVGLLDKSRRLGGDFCGELTASSAGDNDSTPCSELKASKLGVRIRVKFYTRSMLTINDNDSDNDKYIV